MELNDKLKSCNVVDLRAIPRMGGTLGLTPEQVQHIGKAQQTDCLKKLLAEHPEPKTRIDDTDAIAPSKLGTLPAQEFILSLPLADETVKTIS